MTSILQRTCDLSAAKIELAAEHTRQAEVNLAQKNKIILDERARRLARPKTNLEDQAGAHLDLVTFTLGNEQYGIEAAYVRRIIPFRAFTPLPGAPAFFVGVTNLGGDILAVIDLRLVFGLPVKGLSDLSRLIVIGEDEDEFGILADSTEELKRLPHTELLELPKISAGKRHAYVQGTTSEALVVLSGGVLLSDSSLIIDQQDYLLHKELAR